ncbi:MAG: type II toxin-antitoxin system ParD family antitoxin [Verrucomicrobia bacterium]|nr:type II toxin-antitoxin system ParD family antitoxin [Verrucomicrobiota bacterium]
MDITLTKELESFVEEQVRTGLYRDPSDVVRDALRRLLRESEPQWLEEEIRKGLESGPAQPLTQADWNDIRERGRQRLAEISKK